VARRRTRGWAPRCTLASSWTVERRAAATSRRNVPVVVRCQGAAGKAAAGRRQLEGSLGSGTWFIDEAPRMRRRDRPRRSLEPGPPRRFAASAPGEPPRATRRPRGSQCSKAGPRLDLSDHDTGHQAGRRRQRAASIRRGDGIRAGLHRHPAGRARGPGASELERQMSEVGTSSIWRARTWTWATRGGA